MAQAQQSIRVSPSHGIEVKDDGRLWNEVGAVAFLAIFFLSLYIVWKAYR